VPTKAAVQSLDYDTVQKRLAAATTTDPRQGEFHPAVYPHIE
jgi:hypothetical protein